MELTEFLILRRPPLRDAACGGSSGQGGRLEGRNALIQCVFDSFTASFAGMTRGMSSAAACGTASYRIPI